MVTSEDDVYRSLFDLTNDEKLLQLYAERFTLLDIGMAREEVVEILGEGCDLEYCPESVIQYYGDDENIHIEFEDNKVISISILEWVYGPPPAS